MCIIEIIIESLKPYISDICSIIGVPGWYTSPSSGIPVYRTGIPIPYHFGIHIPRLPGTLCATDYETSMPTLIIANTIITTTYNDKNKHSPYQHHTLL